MLPSVKGEARRIGRFVATKLGQLAESIGRLPGGVTGKELWIEGTVDPVARKALEDRGWKVEDKVRDKLFKKKP